MGARVPAVRPICLALIPVHQPLPACTTWRDSMGTCNPMSLSPIILTLQTRKVRCREVRVHGMVPSTLSDTER